MMSRTTYRAGAQRWPGTVQHPTMPDELFPIAHGGLVIAAPPPGSGSTAVGIVCKLPNGAALIAAGFPPNPLGFLIDKPTPDAPVKRVVGNDLMPFGARVGTWLPAVVAGASTRLLPTRLARNSVGSTRLQLAGQKARRMPNSYPRITCDPSHVQQCGGESGSKAAQVVPGSAYV